MYKNFDLQNVVTPVNVEAYERMLIDSGYDSVKTQRLVNGFKHGFDIGFRGNIKGKRQNSPNLKFRIGDEVDLWNKVMKEVKQKHYAGPYHYDELPFEEYIQSPIGLVPKDNGADSRLIFHLSYPKKGINSINGNIPADKCKVKYPDFMEAIEKCIAEGKFCNISRSDLRAAFRNLGVLPSQWNLLCMKAQSPFDGKWYMFVDKCLPFGSGSSCEIFQSFSNSVAHLVTWVLKLTRPVTNYLDDFLFVALLRAFCNKQVETFLEICKVINFPVSLEKTYWASTRMMFLGFLIDTVRQLVCIPMEKIAKGLNMINYVLSRKKITLHELQKLCRFLNFLSQCVVPGPSVHPQIVLKHQTWNEKASPLESKYGNEDGFRNLGKISQ